MRYQKTHGAIIEQLFYHAHGIDQTILSEKYTPKSTGFGKSQILKRDYINQYEIEVAIREMVDDNAARLRKHKEETGVVHLSIGYSRDIVEKSFSHQMEVYPTSSNAKIIETCLHIFRSYYTNQSVRQIFIRCGQMDYKKEQQLNLLNLLKHR